MPEKITNLLDALFENDVEPDLVRLLIKGTLDSVLRLLDVFHPCFCIVVDERLECLYERHSLEEAVCVFEELIVLTLHRRAILDRAFMAVGLQHLSGAKNATKARAVSPQENDKSQIDGLGRLFVEVVPVGDIQLCWCMLEVFLSRIECADKCSEVVNRDMEAGPGEPERTILRTKLPAGLSQSKWTS